MSLYNLVTDNFKEYDLDTEYINMLYVKAETCLIEAVPISFF